MKSLFLVVFCALGVGLAAALALHSETPPEGAFQPFSSALAVETNAPPQHGAAASLTTAKIGAAAIKHDAFSSLAALAEPPQLHPAVARKIDHLESKLEQAVETSEQNERLLRNAVSTLQNVALLQATESHRHAATPPVAPAVPKTLQGVLLEALPPETPPSETRLPETLPSGAIPSKTPLPAEQSRAKVSPGEGDQGLTINIQESNIREVLDLLSAQGLNILASPNVQGTVSASLHDVTVEEALHAILKSSGLIARPEGDFIYVGTAADFVQMDQSVDTITTRVYRPNYVTAAELQTLITPLLTVSVGQASVSSPAETGIAANNAAAGGDDFGGGEVVVVRDYRSILELLDDVVLEVDQRPQQVSIEAMILSVELRNNNDRGVDFELLRNQQNTRLVSGSPLTSLGAIDVTDGGLKFGFLDSSLALFIEALETVGDTNVVASPRLLCLNKQKAEILIGAQLGYVSTTVTENAATQTVNFLEVGTQLRLRPFISRDGVIRLEIHPELSTGTVEVVGGFTLPNKTVTQVTTNVSCRDGDTVILGGLIREDVSEDVKQIPLLGSLPMVGRLFRQTKEKLTRTEIIVLLTPRIVGDGVAGGEGAAAASAFYNRNEVRKDKMSPVGRRFYGKRYLRHAQAAWSAGDADVALRYINLSIHFNPLDTDAVELRGQIMAGSGLGDATIDTHLRQGLAPWGHPVRDYSKTGAFWDRPSLPLEARGLLEIQGPPGAHAAPVIVDEAPSGEQDNAPGVIEQDFSIGEPGPIRDLQRERPR